ARRGLFFDATENEPGDRQGGKAAQATPGADVGGVAKLGVVDEVGPLSAEVLLDDEGGRGQRLGVLRVQGRKKLADQRQRPHLPAPDRRAARGVAADNQASAVFAEVTSVGAFFRDLPAPCQTYAVGVQQAAKSLAIRSPAQIGVGVDSPLGGLPEVVARTEQEAAEHARQGDLVLGQRRSEERRVGKVCRSRWS